MRQRGGSAGSTPGAATLFIFGNDPSSGEFKCRMSLGAAADAGVRRRRHSECPGRTAWPRIGNSHTPSLTPSLGCPCRRRGISVRPSWECSRNAVSDRLSGARVYGIRNNDILLHFLLTREHGVLYYECDVAGTNQRIVHRHWLIWRDHHDQCRASSSQSCQRPEVHRVAGRARRRVRPSSPRMPSRMACWRGRRFSRGKTGRNTPATTSKCSRNWIRTGLQELEVAERIVSLSWRLRRAGPYQNAVFEALYDRHAAEPAEGSACPDPGAVDRQRSGARPDAPGGLLGRSGLGAGAAVRAADREQLEPGPGRPAATAPRGSDGRCRRGHPLRPEAGRVRDGIWPCVSTARADFARATSDLALTGETFVRNKPSFRRSSQSEPEGAGPPCTSPIRTASGGRVHPRHEVGNASCHGEIVRNKPNL